jgi:hypothetical protein
MGKHIDILSNFIYPFRVPELLEVFREREEVKKRGKGETRDEVYWTRLSDSS